jgi:hypothetical protein
MYAMVAILPIRNERLFGKILQKCPFCQKDLPSTRKKLTKIERGQGSE